MNKNALMVAALIGSMAGTAHAGLTGDVVTTEFGSGEVDFGTINSIVGAGAEGDYFGSQVFDFSDMGFTMSSTDAFCGIDDCSKPSPVVTLRLSSLDFGEPLVGVTLTTLLKDVSVSFGSTFVEFQWNEQSIPNTTYLSAQFVTGVPEPEACAMLLAGLGLIGVAAKRRR